MKSFNNFADCFEWVNKVVNKASIQSIEDIAKQEYKDSKEFIYIDTENMYDTGKESNFKNGKVTLKAPQVRWLYYTNGIHPHKNIQAVPQWHEATKSRHLKEYIDLFKQNINQFKKGT